MFMLNQASRRILENANFRMIGEEDGLLVYMSKIESHHRFSGNPPGFLQQV